MNKPIVKFLENDSLGFGKVEIRFDNDPENRFWITGIRVIKDMQLGYLLSNPRNAYTGGFKDYDYRYDIDEAVSMFRAGIIDDIIFDWTGECYCAIYKDRDYAAKCSEEMLRLINEHELEKNMLYTIRAMDVEEAYINVDTGSFNKPGSYCSFNSREEAQEALDKIYARVEKFRGINFDADTLCHMIDTGEMNMLDVYAIEHFITGKDLLRVQATPVSKFAQ